MLETLDLRHKVRKKADVVTVKNTLKCFYVFQSILSAPENYLIPFLKTACLYLCFIKIEVIARDFASALKAFIDLPF